MYPARVHGYSFVRRLNEQDAGSPPSAESNALDLPAPGPYRRPLHRRGHRRRGRVGGRVEAGDVQEGPRGPRARSTARQSGDGEGEVLVGPREDPGASEHPEPGYRDHRRGRRRGGSEPSASAATRRDSAPRGGERGPDASPGHRRARTGEGAGEAAAGRVDVVIAPLREISTQQLLSRPEDGSSSESHIDLWTYLSSRRRMGLDTHQSFEVKAAPSRPGPSSVVGWQWHTRSLVFGRLPTYRRSRQSPAAR